MNAQQVTVWIGMSAPKHGEREGIYRAAFDTRSGQLESPELAAEVAAPGFVALHPDGTRLYAICRLPEGGGGVAAFEVEPRTHELRLLNTEPIADGEACHIAVDATARCLFTAQYGAGSVAAFPLSGDGRIQPRSALVRHSGPVGPNKPRQDKPHPHWVGADSANRFLFVPDLGTDRIVIYEIDHAAGTIAPHGHASSPVGSGPRHMKFHPNGRFAYVVNELELSVTAFEYDAERGSLNAIETIPTLSQQDATASGVTNTASEIRIHPSGRFLYAANRGHDSIAAFEINPDTGRLTLVQIEPARGQHPRNFNIDPTGQWLLSAGRDSDSISVFRIDSETGRLASTGQTVSSPSPICLEFQSRQ